MEALVGHGLTSGGWGSSDGTSVGDVSTCEHDYSEIAYDDYIHWRKCSKCGETQTNSEATHTFDKATNSSEEGVHGFVCTFEGCAYTKKEAHQYGSDGYCIVDDCDANNSTQAECEHDFTKVAYDETNHWKRCSKCDAIEEGSTQQHTLGDYEDNLDGTHLAECTLEGCQYSDCKKHEFNEDGNCTTCDAQACDSGDHYYSVTQWTDDEHWIKCKWCDVVKLDSIGVHTFGDWETDENGTQIAHCTFDNCQYYIEKEETFLVGDINLDGNVNIADLLFIKRHIIAGTQTSWQLYGTQLKLADLNNDGNVNIADVITLKRIILESM